MAEINLIPPHIQKQNQNQAPLSSSQEGLWYVHQLAPDSPGYNSINVFKMTGRVDRAILERSLNELVHRHEILQTIYTIDQEGKPVQVILPFHSFGLSSVDFSSLKADEKEKSIRDYAIEHGATPFDLQNGPILRSTLLQVGPEENYLFFAIHHIAFDGWSRHIFIQDLLRLYAAYQSGQEPDLPALPVSYIDYVLWQKKWFSGEIRAAHVKHWKNILSGDLPVLAMPTDHPRQSVQTVNGARYSFDLPPRLASHLREFSSHAGFTRFQVLMAAYALLLMRYTGQEDIIIGCPFANRPLPEQDGMIGLFVNSLPIRLNLGGDPGGRELIAQVRRATLDAFTWKAIPFDTLVAEIAPQRDPTRTPIFQASINMQNSPRRQRSIPGLETDIFLREQILADEDICMEFYDADDRLTACLLYNTNLFDSSTILRMASHYQNLLEQLLSWPDRSISGLEILSPMEKQQILVDWNNTATDYPQEKCLHQLFEEQVQQSPDSPAVLFGEKQLTYRELNSQANQLASSLRNAGVGPEKIVGLYFRRSIEMIVAILGTLKAGGAYLPLSTDDPPNRIAYLFMDALPQVVLTVEKLRKKLPEGTPNIITLDVEWNRPTEETMVNSTSQALPDSLACVIYTSGSTGEPKGVMLTHRALCSHFYCNQLLFHRTPEDRVLHQMALSFDFAIWEIFTALLNGAQLIVVDPDRKLDASYLADLIENQRITIAGFVPSHLEVFLEMDIPGKGNSLQQILCGGEILSPKLQERFFQIYPSARLYNGYGPTETTIFATWWECRKNEQRERIPIGRPNPNTQLYILSTQLQPVPIGVTGELYIGGPSLARGYLNNPGLTAEKFIPNPFAKEMDNKLYKTGDLARWLPDGNIEFLGRIDDQIKLRGFRIELSEIETILRRHPGVQQGYVTIREDQAGFKQLVGYIIPAEAANLDQAQLHEFMVNKLPGYMVPAVYVFLDSFPLTVNGKINRSALPTPESGMERSQYIPPGNEMETRLVSIWKELLGLERVGVEDGFFELGGHSLLAARLVAHIRQETGQSLPLAALLENDTVRKQAELIAADSTNSKMSLELIPRANRNRPIPASSSQRGLWFQYLLEGPSSTYNITSIIRLTGKLDVPALERSIHYLITRHDSLRMSFTAVDGDPYLAIADTVEWKLEIRHSHGQKMEQELVEVAARPFYLEQAPLFRAFLWTDSDDQCILLFSFHHSITDGWSQGIFETELSSVYTSVISGAEPALPFLELDYADYAAWQYQQLKHSDFAQGLTYWNETLQGAPELLDLPIDRPRPAVQTYHGSEIGINLPNELSDQLRALARREKMTFFMVMSTAYAILLSHYCRQEDLVIGIPLANRPRKELEHVLGYFVNMLPLRVDLRGNPDLSQLLHRIRQGTLDAIKWQSIPFENLVYTIPHHRDPKYSPIYQTMFSLDESISQEFQLGESQGLFERPVSNVAKSDLSLGVETWAGNVHIAMEYNLALFDLTTVERMLDHYRHILFWMVSNPTCGINELGLLTELEQQKILFEWNDNDADYPDQNCLQELFAAQVKRTPDGLALIFAEQHLTYRELDQRADTLAEYLRSVGVGPEKIVGLYLKRSMEMIVGILGTLKAGGAYLALSTEDPASRLSSILADAQPGIVLTIEQLRNKLPEAKSRILSLDTQLENHNQKESSNPFGQATPDSLACVIYTSGSTGAPKGVMLTHRALCSHFYCDQLLFHRMPEDRVLHHMALSFDFAIWEIFTALLNGAQLVVADPDRQLDGSYLADLIEDQKITIAGFVPSHLETFLETQIPGKGNSLRQVLCGGEILSPKLQERFFQIYPSTKLYNTYGPTEATIDVTHWECRNNEQWARIPIGRPNPNSQLYILDAWRQPVPIGVAGELYIGGLALARGYLNHPDITAEKFIPNPFSKGMGGTLYKSGDMARWLPDGNIEYLGRFDEQVKLRGFRIELGEIEHTLRRHPRVQQALVVLREDQPGNKQLVGYVLPKLGTNLDQAQLHEYLKDNLPGYMVPAAFVFLDTFPLTGSGKIDRLALPCPESEMRTEQYLAPENDMEKKLLPIWQEILGVKRIGVVDAFFDLGGNSLLAARLVGRIQQETGQTLPLAALLENDTVRKQAELLAGVSTIGRKSLVAIRPDGTKKPIFCLPGGYGDVLYLRNLAKYVDSDRPLYGLQTISNESSPAYDIDLKAIASAFLAEIIQLQPEGPYYLAGHSFGGFIALEMAHQLTMQGHKVAFLGLWDTIPPGNQQQASLPDRVLIHMQNLRGLGPRQIVGYLKDRWTNLMLRLTLFAPVRSFLEWINFKPKNPIVAATISSHGFNPDPYPGDVFLFEVKQRPWYVRWDPMENWKKYVHGKLEIREVQGEHSTLLFEPYVQDLAHQFNDCLRLADEKLIQNLP
jgi:amino acid adenylation domain-containing protein